VSHDERRDSAATGAIESVHIASADPARTDTHQHVVFADVRDWQIRDRQ
jgi:hypothetical protein